MCSLLLCHSVLIFFRMELIHRLRRRILAAWVSAASSEAAWNENGLLTRAPAFARQLKQAVPHPLRAPPRRQRAIWRNSSPSPALVHWMCLFLNVHNECLNRLLAVEGAPPLQLLPSPLPLQSLLALGFWTSAGSRLWRLVTLLFSTRLSLDRLRRRGGESGARPSRRHNALWERARGGGALGGVLCNKPQQRRSD